MIDSSESPLLGPDEGPAVEVLNPDGAGNVLLVCEHASRFIPAALNGLGLSDEAATSHAAWDIGALDLACALSVALDAPLVAGRVSRLVYDCNRPPEATDAIPARSERFAVPGNAQLTAATRAQRVAEVYRPFRAALSEAVSAGKARSALVTVHSFTPVYNGIRRQLDLGLLHDADPALAEAMLAAADGSALRTAINEPYSSADGVTHTLRDHAVPIGLANVMIEIRNDLIDTAAGVNRIAEDLLPMLGRALATVTDPREAATQ